MNETLLQKLQEAGITTLEQDLVKEQKATDIFSNMISGTLSEGIIDSLLKVTYDPKTRQYLNEVITYTINEAKWKAADLFCKEHGWQFKILTEKDLGL